nr:hypothetical protein [Macrococcus canis]
MYLSQHSLTLKNLLILILLPTLMYSLTLMYLMMSILNHYLLY